VVHIVTTVYHNCSCPLSSSAHWLKKCFMCGCY